MIIGLGYKQQVGKDFAAQILRDKRGYQIMAFADPLYALCFRLCGYNPAWSTVYALREAFKVQWQWMRTPWRWLKVPVKGRWLLQWLGSEIVRQSVQHLWLALMAHEIRALARAGSDLNIVVSGVRFPDEAKLLRQLGRALGQECKLVNIELTPDLERAVRRDTQRHVSDTAGALIDWDLKILNDKSIDFEAHLLKALRL